MTQKNASRKEQRRQEAAKQKRNRSLAIALPIALVALAFIAFIVIRNFAPEIEGVLDFGTQEQGHDEDATYETAGLPPVGGVHSPRWQNCGIYDQPVEIKNAVHSMEHGAVWIAYQPDLEANEVETLQDLVRGQSYILLSPFTGLSSEVVLSAWGIQLAVDSVTDERIAQFIDQYRLGPQTPEFGAACDGSVGQPLS